MLNVPASVHRTLKAQAALAGMSLSDFLLAEIRRDAERPTMAELRERLRRRSLPYCRPGLRGRSGPPGAGRT